MTDAQWGSLLAAVAGRGGGGPAAFIVDSPWMPGFVGLHTLDFFLDTRAWLDAHLALLSRFPGVVFLPGFWVEYGMANEPSGFGARVLWHPDQPPGIRPLELPPSEWAGLPRPEYCWLCHSSITLAWSGPQNRY